MVPRRSSRRPLLVTPVVAALALGVLPLGLAAPATAADLSDTGRFLAPFEEVGPDCVEDADGRSICKPAAASVVVLPNGKILYWDALEGMEDPELNAVAEFGKLDHAFGVLVHGLRAARTHFGRSFALAAAVRAVAGNIGTGPGVIHPR